jgi:hypothetical protein
MTLCPEADERAALPDGEFWDRVLDQQPPDEPDGPDLDQTTNQMTPCTECGELGACGYDAEGRAMFHRQHDDEEASDGD